MKLQFFGRGFLGRLQDSVPQNLSKYDAANAWLDELGKSRKFIHDSRYVVGPPPTLIVDSADRTAGDAENAKRIYTWLREIPPSTAMELRLWAYLTHCVFASYMQLRWPPNDEKLIKRRYLFEGASFASLSRNGISRLWWAGYLTHDKKRPEPFELTDMLFLLQDIQVSVLERRIGKCRAVRTAMLEFVRDNRARLSEKSFGKRIQRIAKEVNLLGGVAILDALPHAEIQSLLARAGATVMDDAA